ncbi:MAG TPA: ABC transporter ATP-binding protein [Devosia sp.]|jgi:peptide/nickel transport system ATP-binding protein|nr:ABC transporter ATP-binding protein [Devosia sp.]
MAETALAIDDLSVHYRRAGSSFRREEGVVVRAVDGVSLTVRRGETLGLVGESGCGKSTTGRTVVGGVKATAGSVTFTAAEGTMSRLGSGAQPSDDYRRKLRMIFQDPNSSLNPRFRIAEIVGEPLRNFGLTRGRREREERVGELLRQVGLRPEYLKRYPHAFSGGERQRIGIARALATKPELVVADEAVSALDVSVRAQIINLLRDLQEQRNLTYLFISHDLGVVEHICDRVAVMYVGRLVELAPRRSLFATPRHPYTEALLSAVPSVHKTGRDRIRLSGEVADPAAPPPGCHFHPRCRFAVERCRVEIPKLRELEAGHSAAHGGLGCWHAFGY